MIVCNMTSTRTGRAVANQYIIRDGAKIIFQSYDSIIATIDRHNKTITIGEDYNYSVTTAKYRNAFFTEFVPALNTLDSLNKAIASGNCLDYTVKMEG